jgi:hypothetical protein
MPGGTFISGLAWARSFYGADVVEDIDQFIVRFVEGKLLSERLIRLPGGYASTEREDDAHQAKRAAVVAALSQSETLDR